MRLIAILMGVLCFTIACGGGDDPNACLKEADQAFFSDKNYDKAGKLYTEIINWKNKSVQPTEDQRFYASFNLVRCKVFNKDYNAALVGIEDLHKTFPKQIVFKNYGTIINELVNLRAVNEAIEVVILASNHFPGAKDDIKKHAEHLKKLSKKGASKEQIDKLKAIPYF